MLMEVFEKMWHNSQGKANRLNQRKEADMSIPDDERIIVARAMHAYGGHFISQLGLALFRADPDNTAKIKQAWSDEWERYKQIGEEEQNDTGEPADETRVTECPESE